MGPESDGNKFEHLSVSLHLVIVLESFPVLICGSFKRRRWQALSVCVEPFVGRLMEEMELGVG